MKRKKRIIRMFAAVLAASVLGSWGVPARAAGPAQVTVTVDGADGTPRRAQGGHQYRNVHDQRRHVAGERKLDGTELFCRRAGYDALGV